jgi:hypothetical protein
MVVNPVSVRVRELELCQLARWNHRISPFACPIDEFLAVKIGDSERELQNNPSGERMRDAAPSSPELRNPSFTFHPGLTVPHHPVCLGVDEGVLQHLCHSLWIS